MEIISFLGLIILASFHSVIYLMIAIVSLIYLVCYLRGKWAIIKDKPILIFAIILELIFGIHFISLWSNLVVIKKISQMVHIPAILIVAAIALIIGVFSYEGTIVFVNMAISNIRFMVDKLKKQLKVRLRIEHLTYLLFCITMVITIASKCNYHLDEMMSYGLSNHKDGIYMSFEEGVKYEPSEEPYLEYLTAAPEYRFDYEIAYANQESDVHPPLYYYFLHTICSMFPGVFNKWFAGSINIIFGMATIILLTGIIRRKIHNEKIRCLVLVAFSVSAGILNATAFFRMYIMAMFICLLLLKLIIDGYDKEKCNYHYYGKLGIVLLTGAMTHYYIIIYAALLFTTYGVVLIIRKRWADVAGIIVSSGIAAAFSILIFPKMLFHMFTGYRGEEALENVSSYGHAFFPDFLRVLRVIDCDITGNLGFVLLILIAIMGVIRRIRLDRKELIKYLLVFVPTIAYCGAVLRLAGRIENRYFYPVYAVFFLMIVVEVVYLIDLLFDKYKVLVIAFVLIAMLVSVYHGYNWEYLYTNTMDLADFSAENADTDCLYIYRDRWMVQPSFVEARNYKSITFVKGEHMNMLSELEIKNVNKLIVIIAEVDDEEVREKIFEAFPNLSDDEYVGSHSLGKTYIYK